MPISSGGKAAGVLPLTSVTRPIRSSVLTSSSRSALSPLRNARPVLDLYEAVDGQRAFVQEHEDFTDLRGTRSFDRDPIPGLNIGSMLVPRTVITVLTRYFRFERSREPLCVRRDHAFSSTSAA